VYFVASALIGVLRIFAHTPVVIKGECWKSRPQKERDNNILVPFDSMRAPTELFLHLAFIDS
jgi:hypothetical protein